MIRTISPKAMQAYEQKIMQQTGLPGLLLMEHASRAVAEQLDKSLYTLFLCGPGNNGGDGFAAARLFHLAGGQCEVWRLPGELKGDALTNWQLLQALCPRVKLCELTALQAFPPQTAQIVDALFGTGLDRPLTGLPLEWVRQINASHLPVIAVDIPSGLSGQTGQIMGEAVKATKTVTFHRPKDGLYLAQGRSHTGEIIIAPIFLPQGEAEGYDILEAADISQWLPPRKRDSHKGDYGRVLIRAGSPNMAGAAGLCAQAALRTGAGLVTVCCDETTALTVHTLAPCATCCDESARPQADVMAAGPGLGQGGEDFLKEMRACEKPCIWDADALNWLARQESCALPAHHFATPHPGEAARLLGCTPQQVEFDRPAALRALYKKLGCTVILKGAVTLIISHEGKAMNLRGTPAMAKGGSGDALTGILAALAAKGLSPLRTAQLACLLHGMAGEAAALKLGENAVTAMDLIDCLGKEMTP
ncbi:MAG: NAD(P)H-hydrate dehydratase [Clostridia bacterium]|nr:NAD(P)H-hydrate dehydratase [Clostridia bacterium]